MGVGEMALTLSRAAAVGLSTKISVKNKVISCWLYQGVAVGTKE